MNNPNKCGIENLLQLFEEALAPEDALIAKLMAQISTAITKERLKLGMSQTDFAKHIETSQPLVSRWEHGDYNFTIRKIAEIAVKLGLDVNIEMAAPQPCHNFENFTNNRNFLKSATICYSEDPFSGNSNTIYKNILPFRTLQSTYEEEYCHASVR